MRLAVLHLLLDVQPLHLLAWLELALPCPRN
jgi:hypothetical protein